MGGGEAGQAFWPCCLVVVGCSPYPPWPSSTARSGEIGARLRHSVGTVKAHLSSALAKPGLDNHMQLALLVHDAGAR
ncbi:helix-turn-helix transcriptional regulator [Streptomyces sp. NBC_01003]|uniref:hypothetical protein n=1 Tax=Streptomyces sp. NBC_01003 TaxID=2903714 RepID=UPI003867421B|nr:helix-turn-helix transcriptional regulator [Streptomyces sp. NBC_01003]